MVLDLRVETIIRIYSLVIKFAFVLVLLKKTYCHDRKNDIDALKSFFFYNRDIVLVKILLVIPCDDEFETLIG
jgi:hypothetical protein